MSMFDYYIPKPAIHCPTCGKAIEEWQGKHGPNLMLLWEQGWALPVGNALQINDANQLRLPSRFVISAVCCGQDFLADCECENGVWTKGIMRKASNIETLRAKYGPPPTDAPS